MEKDRIKVGDLWFRKMIAAERIAEAVATVAAKINAEYRDMEEPPIILGVLNGSFIFMSDLVRLLDFRCEMSFVKLSSYEGQSTSGTVKELIGINGSLAGRHVIIVEDIVDTGVSITHMLKQLRGLDIASVRVCTLFFKPNSYRGTDTIDFPAMTIGNEFIVGYGLDYNELGRELRDIYVVDNE